MDEREIEAVAQALYGEGILDDPNTVGREMALRDARKAIVALGRVRDAQGDEEAARREAFTTHWVPREEWLKVCAERGGYMLALDAIRAQSPQDEDHEDER